MRIGAAPAVAYAVLFTLLLPLSLVAWMLRLDRILALPPVDWTPAGLALLAVGAAIAGSGLRSLWRHGGGLPMSPFPPPRLATRGAYRLVADPIYIGSAFLCAGTAVVLASPSGLFIVTPVFAAAMAAFVLGYERDATTARFGAGPRTLLRLPAATDERPSAADRLAVYLLVLVPWIVLYQAVEYLGAPRDGVSVRVPAEAVWPVIGWTEAIYLLAYVLAALAPLVPVRRNELRRLAVDGLVATALIIPIYLLVPLVAEAKPVPGGTAWAVILEWERAGDSAVTAFPAFHVVWACIAGATLVRRWPRARPAVVALALAVGASCVTTGMHAVVDVVAGFAAWGAVGARHRIWTGLCRATEAAANSWRDRTIGPVRVISHGVYAGIGAAAGLALAVTMGGPGAAWWLIGFAVIAEVGAAAWAQVVEGSTQLLRPYGYFGSIVAVVAAAPVAWAAGIDPWLLLAAFSAGACVTQAFGRVRCLVQGCCHGKLVDAPWGIRYRHPRSRVVRLSALGGQPVHPTQLYAILSSLAICAVLVRLWTLSASLPFIVGTYLVLMGLTRFVEEHYRGEPQTACVGGLRLYQWLAVAFVVAGAALTSIGGAPAPAPAAVPGSVWAAIALLGVLTYAAYGVDFPRSNRRFSRLV